MKQPESAPSPRRFAMLLVVAVAAAWATAAVAAPKVIGIASALVNDVRIKPASLSEFAKAKLRQRVALADRVRTGQRSRMQIILLDRTKFTVGANAELKIDRFVYDPNGGSVSASMAKGALRFMSGSSRKAKKTIQSPSATIGIRGTVLDLAVGQAAVNVAQRERSIPAETRHDPLTATLVVLRGPGPNRQPGLAAGLVDIMAAGQTVTLDAPLLAAYVPYQGAAPIGPFPISLSGLGLLSDFIVPPPQRNFRPFQASDLPFADDRLRDPPPYLGQPGTRGDPGFRPGDGNRGGFPGASGFPRPGSMPGTNGGMRGPDTPQRDPVPQQPGSDNPADTAPRDPNPDQPRQPLPGRQQPDGPSLQIGQQPNGPSTNDRAPQQEPAVQQDYPNHDSQQDMPLHSDQ